MIVHLIRHGETSANRDAVGLGRADLPLTDLGLRQAAAVGARMASEPIEHIFTSPLQRCRRVAAAIAGERAIPVEPRDELLELDVGATEFMKFPDVRTQFPEFVARWAGPDGHLAVMPGGESLADLDGRLESFVAHLRTLRHGSIAVVSHNFVTKLLVARLMNLEPSAHRSIGIDLASLSTVEFRETGATLVRQLNCRCHLNGLAR